MKIRWLVREHGEDLKLGCALVLFILLMWLSCQLLVAVSWWLGEQFPNAVSVIGFLGPWC